MQIFIKDPSGKATSVEINSGDSIYRIKERLSYVTDFKPDQVILKLDEMELVDSFRVSQYDIYDQTYLRLITKDNGQAKTIFLISFDGEKYQINMSLTATVAKFKQQVGYKTGISTGNQRLMFSGRALDNDYKMLSDYGISHGCTVQIVNRCKGGDILTI